MRAFRRFFSVRSNLTTNPIEDSVATNEFKIKLNNDFASVNYEKIDGRTYNLLHSYIPETYRGQGLAPIFAQRILDHLVQNDKKIKLSCDFLQKYFNKNREKYENFVVNDLEEKE